MVRGLVIVGLAYLAFTYFVPIRNQPRWVTQAELMPVVQTTADLLLSVVPDQSRDYAVIPHHDEVRQAPPQGHDPVADLIHRNGYTAPKKRSHERPDPQNEASNSVPKTTREPVQQKSAVRHQEILWRGRPPGR